MLETATGVLTNPIQINLVVLHGVNVVEAFKHFPVKSVMLSMQKSDFNYTNTQIEMH